MWFKSWLVFLSATMVLKIVAGCKMECRIMGMIVGKGFENAKKEKYERFQRYQREICSFN